MTQNYPHIIKFLRGLKGLSEDEAQAFFRICNRESVSVKEVTQIFRDLKIKISRTRAYTIVDKFKQEGLIFLLVILLKLKDIKQFTQKLCLMI